jgi:hypothetical protein
MKDFNSTVFKYLPISYHGSTYTAQVLKYEEIIKDNIT